MFAFRTLLNSVLNHAISVFGQLAAKTKLWGQIGYRCAGPVPDHRSTLLFLHQFVRGAVPARLHRQSNVDFEIEQVGKWHMPQAKTRHFRPHITRLVLVVTDVSHRPVVNLIEPAEISSDWSARRGRTGTQAIDFAEQVVAE